MKQETTKSATHFIVEKSSLLLEFLLETVDLPKKKIKSLLSHGNISVNQIVRTKYDYPLHKSDSVEIHFGKMITVQKRELLSILYEDHEFIVINKPCHLLSVATQKEKEKTAYRMVKEHVCANHKNEKVFVLHRLDRETSGVLVFVKNERLKNMLQDQWNECVTLRGYTAMVEGTNLLNSGTLKHYLAENKAGKVYVTNDSKNGKLAITKYRKLKEVNGNTILDIKLGTGRKNQIRVQFAHIGYPIVGDTKYGSMTHQKRMELHASELEFIHPITHKKYYFSAPLPNELNTGGKK